MQNSNVSRCENYIVFIVTDANQMVIEMPEFNRTEAHDFCHGRVFPGLHGGLPYDNSNEEMHKEMEAVFRWGGHNPNFLVDLTMISAAQLKAKEFSSGDAAKQNLDLFVARFGAEKDAVLTFIKKMATTEYPSTVRTVNFTEGTVQRGTHFGKILKLSSE